MERRRIRFTGRVQGVGFRATARATAAAFPVTGWVRNEPDGSVLAEVQGEPADIDRFLAALRSRMEHHLSGVSSTPLPPDETEAAFDIRF